MSDAEQQLQRQQHSKTSKDGNTASTAATPTTSSTSTSSSSTTSASPRKLAVHELRNQDYVSRLMAATPPYLYSAPVVGQNNFFFSDMLRSLVAARNSENARNLQLQQQQHHHHHQQQQQQQTSTTAVTLNRRPRKRLWSHHQRPPMYMEHLRGASAAALEVAKEEKPTLHSALMTAAPPPAPPSQPVAEKPLELTTYKMSQAPLFHLAAKCRKLEALADTKKAADTDDLSPAAVPAAGGAVDSNAMHGTPPAASLPPQDLVLPPPPPVWYPPLYPPYGIDPLHFFIDLRVSGHIYDRKKENVSPLTTNITENANATAATCAGDAGDAPNPIGMLNKHRQGSAFTVPVPRSNPTAGSVDLTSTKYYDLSEAKENQPFGRGKTAPNGASYMLQHLPRLYSHFAARDLLASNVAAAAAAANTANMDGDGETAALSDGDNKSEADCDADSEEAGERCASVEEGDEEPQRSERDIDVEIVDSIKYRTDGESSRCSSGDETGSVTQID